MHAIFNPLNYSSEVKAINGLIDGLPLIQRFYLLRFYAACWDAQTRIVVRSGAGPDHSVDPRPQHFLEKDYYYQRCHLLVAAMQELGKLCQTCNIAPNEDALLSLLDPRWMVSLTEAYELDRLITVEALSIHEFMRCIYRNNRLAINEFEVRPGELDFLTDDYGQDMRARQWVISQNGEIIKTYPRLHGDELVEAYELIFGQHSIGELDNEAIGLINSFRSVSEYLQETN